MTKMETEVLEAASCGPRGEQGEGQAQAHAADRCRRGADGRWQLLRLRSLLRIEIRLDAITPIPPRRSRRSRRRRRHRSRSARHGHAEREARRDRRRARRHGCEARPRAGRSRAGSRRAPRSRLRGQRQQPARAARFARFGTGCARQRQLAAAKADFERARIDLQRRESPRHVGCDLGRRAHENSQRLTRAPRRVSRRRKRLQRRRAPTTRPRSARARPTRCSSMEPRTTRIRRSRSPAPG